MMFTMLSSCPTFNTEHFITACAFNAECNSMHPNSNVFNAEHFPLAVFTIKILNTNCIVCVVGPRQRHRMARTHSTLQPWPVPCMTRPGPSSPLTLLHPRAWRVPHMCRHPPPSSAPSPRTPRLSKCCGPIHHPPLPPLPPPLLHLRPTRAPCASTPGPCVSSGKLPPSGLRVPFSLT